MGLDAWYLPGLLLAAAIGMVAVVATAAGDTTGSAAAPLDRSWVQTLVEDDASAAMEPGWGGAIASWERVPGVDVVRPANVESREFFTLPLRRWNAITDQFGVPRGEGHRHGGIDLGLYGYEASPVYAACSGVVTYADYSNTYGYYAAVDCGGGWSTLSAHFRELRVRTGDRVDGGVTVVGISGSTGYSTGEHLHFEVRWQGLPIDPQEVLDFNGG